MKRNIALLGVFSMVVAALLLTRVLSPGGTAHGTGTSIFGDGSDGARTFGSDAMFYPPADAWVIAGSAGATTFTVSSVVGTFQAGQKIMIHQTRGGTALSGQPNWEINEVQNYVGGNISTTAPLANSYATSGASLAQVLVAPEYTDVTVNSGATVVAQQRNYEFHGGGILAFMASGTVTVAGTISATGQGFYGTQTAAYPPSQAGEGTAGPALPYQQAANGSGGGGAGANAQDSGGGGGNGTAGGAGGGSNPGGAGAAAGNAELTTMVFGGGGGAGLDSASPQPWGKEGGGIILIFAKTLTVTGAIAANGVNGVTPGGANAGGAGGGAGGSILLKADVLTLGSSLMMATGGTGGIGQGSGASGGAGGVGRIRLEYCASGTGGNASPPAVLQQITCKPVPSQLNITKLGQYSPPKSCYNVYNPANQSVVLFQVCDNDWLGAPATNAVCTHAGNLCTDENAAQGAIQVNVSAGDYHIVESVAPPNHTISTGKQDCDASAGSCAVTVIDAPIVRPWYPWDITGRCRVPDGLVRVDDVVSVVNHYRQDKPLPGTPQPTPTPTLAGTATPTATPIPGC